MSKSILAGKLTEPLIFDSGYGWIAHYSGSPFTPDSTVPIANSHQVILFEHINFEGSFKVLEIGTYSNPRRRFALTTTLVVVSKSGSCAVSVGELMAFILEHRRYYSAFLRGGPHIGNDTVSSVEVSWK
jgi:hypothetical protein